MDLSKFNIKGLYNYVMDTNPSNNLPYHNNNHLKRVCEFVMKACDYYNSDDNNKRLLIISSLFHDYNHTGTSTNDDINIENAISGIKEYNQISNNKLNDSELTKVCDIIKSTRYPMVSNPKDILQEIICDCDILQGLFTNDYINDTVLKIAEENNIPKSKLIENQTKFLKSLKFHTKWANDIFKERTPYLLKMIGI